MKLSKITAVICVLTLLLGGCYLPTPRKSEPIQETYHDSTKYIDEFRHRLHYQQLSDSEKHNYGQIYTAVRDSETSHTATIDIDGTTLPGIRIPLSNDNFDRQQMSHLFEAFFRDNPRFFYLDRTYSLEGYEQEGTAYYNALLLRFTMDTDQRIKAFRQLDAAVNRILSECPDTEDEYAVELYLHNRLLTSCDYDTYAASASSDECANAYSAYGALVEGKAVCEGYAKAMQLLLDARSIASTVVLGRSGQDGEAHMWNLVSINGNYYYLDPTWNDDNNGIQYTYFNITSTMLSRTHILEDDALAAITCTEIAENYHYRSGTYIDTYERDAIAEIIANCVLQGKDVIQLRFADGKYENALLFLKNISFAQKTINKFLSHQTMWSYELLTQSSQGTITLCKKQ